MKGSTQAHQRLMQETFLMFSKHFPHGRIFPRQVGLFLTQNGSPIQIGMPGMADAYALLPVNNYLVHIEIEFKSGAAKQNPKQKIWEKLIIDLNGLYILVREPQDIVTEILKKYG
jgi:hypothetical protein